MAGAGRGLQSRCAIAKLWQVGSIPIRLRQTSRRNYKVIREVGNETR